MTLKNEIFEGIAAYKALNNPQDKYAEEMYKARRRQNEQDDKLDEYEKNEIAAQNKRRTGGTAMPTTVASTAMPGTTMPATANPMALQPTLPPQPQLAGTYQRGGRVKRYAAGGVVDATDPDANDPDLIVRQLLAEDGTAADKINRQVGEPWTVTGPTSEYTTQGIRDRAGVALDTSTPPAATPPAAAAPPRAEGKSPYGNRKFGGRKFGASAPPPEASVEGSPVVTPASPAPRTQSLDEALATSGGSDASAMALKPPEQFGPNEPTSSALGRAVRSVLPSEESNKKYTELTNELSSLMPGPFTQQSERERAENAPRIAQIEKEIADLRGASAKPATPTALPQGAVPGESVVRTAPRRPNQVPAGTPTVVAGPAGRPVPASTNGPQTPGLPAQGSGNGVVQAPPPGAATSQVPTSAPKPVQTAANVPAATPAPATAVQTNAPGPGGAPVPKGSLGDQTRTEAFDPTGTQRPQDLADPRNAGAVDTAGRTVGTGLNTAEIRQTVAGAMQAAPPNTNGAVGDNAVSRDTFRQFVSTHDEGGKLTPGQAMLVGMVGRYKGLLAQGRMKEAQQMAWGLIQASNIEASAYAKVAMDQMRSGDQRGMVQNLAKSADHVPDGMVHRPGADGKSIETYDQSGKLVSRLPMDGRVALQLAMGLSDGSLMWQALQQTAESMKTPDKNAEGRQLDNEYKRRQIENAILRNKKLAGGGGGKAVAAPSAAAARVDARLPGMPQIPGTSSRSQGGGEADSALPDLNRVTEDAAAE